MKIAAKAAFLVLNLYASSALAKPVMLSDGQLNDVVAGENFVIVNKVADQASVGAPVTDPLLVNPWGISQAPGGPLWIANNETGTSTLYDFHSFAKIPLVVTIPGLNGAQGTPTGTTFVTRNTNGNAFPITANGKSSHSFFLFDSEDGTISGWSPTVDVTHAIIAVDLSATGAAFKGMSLAPHGVTSRLYAADFANNRVDMFDNQFKLIGSFTDPSLPPGYAPFNVQALGDNVYVTFALREQGGDDEVAGSGLGYVVLFNENGRKLRTLVAGGLLNAPWGLTIAPASFGKFAGSLLVGNFGDGKINAYNPSTGAFLGTLSSDATGPLSIEGLWALRNGPDGTVVFSAGPGDETHGLVGVIRPRWAPASWAFQSHVTAP